MTCLLFAGVSALALASPLAQPPTQATAPPPDTAPVAPTPSATVAQVVVTHDRADPPSSQVRVVVSAAEVAETTNVSVVEDELKYLPNVLVRDRHIGDTQAPITTRTSGVGSSARSLVYVDGVLLSALIGNNNTNASPRWGMVSPDAVVSTEVLYGPFAAAYPGNSIGEVVNITTRMPTRLEGSISLEGAGQVFHQYGTDATYPTGRVAATLGDRLGRFAVWFSVNHLDTQSQPLYDITASAITGGAGALTTGGYAGVSRTGAAVRILGAGGLEHQVEDNASLKLAYDLTPQITAAYTLGFFRNNDHAGVSSYLRDTSEAAVYAGTVNIAGASYSIPASAFSNDLYSLQEDHLMQSLSLGSHSGGVFDWKLIASLYDYMEDRQRMPTTALPAAYAGGAGTITSLDGSGWATLDLSASWRPQGAGGANTISFGAHEDRFQLESPKYTTGDWIDGGAGATAALAKGKTQTNAVWVQDAVALTREVKLTLGGRYERWDAYDGLNASVSPALDMRQPAMSKQGFSPKAVLAWTPAAAWRFSGSIGRAYRFPTVEELYQAVTTGNQVSVPNARLRPEDAVSQELSAERSWTGGTLRLSLFAEQVSNALVSQSAPLVAGSSTLYSYVQNIGRTRVQGVELAGDGRDALVRGLELSGWITYVDSKILADAGYAAAVGKQLPQLPRLRGAAVATYRPTPKLSLSVAGRYSDKAFGTIDNSDHVSDTFTGFSAYFVADAHARYRIDPHLTADVGVDNLNGRVYYLYHPFPQRTLVGTLKYAF